jgi:uncharacterized protein YjbI with pentapeptide repeats
MQNAPKIPKHLEDRAVIRIEDEGSIENSSLIGLHLPSQVSKNSKLAQSRLRKVTLAGSSFERTGWFDVVIENSDLTNVSFSESTLQRIILKENRLTGFKGNGCSFKDIEFTDCKADLIEFRFSTLHHVVFRNCNLLGADFQNATLKKVSFKNCTVDKVQFSGAKLDSVDFRTSQLRNLGGVTSLKGAHIDAAQLISLAAELAAALGIAVHEL